MCSISENYLTFAVKYIFFINKINKIMKKNFLKFVGGAVFCLPMMFASCGNVDNPLETIGTGGEDNPFVSVLAGALDDGATVTIDLEACLVGQNKTATATFEKEGDNFTLKTLTGDIVTALDELDYNEDHNYSTATAAQILEWGKLKIDFKYDLAKNQLKAIMEATETGTYYPISIIVFDLSNDSYSQYTYPYLKGYFILTGISVEGDSKIDLISTDYEKEAFVYGGNLNTRAARTRMAAYPNACVFYKDGETWADVNKRYKDVAGNALFNDAEDLTKEVWFLDQSFFPAWGIGYEGSDAKVTYEDKVGYNDNEAYEGDYWMIYLGVIYDAPVEP